VEIAIDRYVADIRRGDLIIEIQTANFSRIARKLRDLVVRHKVRLVYPVPHELWILKPGDKGGETRRRRSPRRRGVIDVFDQLVSFPELIPHENFEMEVVLTVQEELRRHEPGMAWRRRGWVTAERRLVEVHDVVPLRDGADYAALIPAALDGQFTTLELSAALGCRRMLAQRMAYCLRKAGLIEQVGTRGRAVVYERAIPRPLRRTSTRRRRG
jgi:hypothetical protein